MAKLKRKFSIMCVMHVREAEHGGVEWSSRGFVSLGDFMYREREMTAV